MSIAAVIPALNEAQNLPHVLALIPASVRVVVVDNGSTDDTSTVAQDLGAEVVSAEARGYGSAVLAGMGHLQASPPTVMVVLDADGADPAHLMARLTDPIVQGRYDMVLSERTNTSSPGALTRTQRWGNALAVRLITRATGHRYHDMAPFRAIRWSSLMSLKMEDPTWGWNVEMQMKAVHAGMRILELPLPYGRRRHGHSKISGSISGAARAGARILWAVNRYNQP